MLPCLKPSQPASATNNHHSSPASQGFSVHSTPRSNFQPSPTVNLSREYSLAVKTNSYGEIRRTFDQSSLHIDLDFFEGPHFFEQILQPSHETIKEALLHAKPSPLTDLIASYFDLSEHTFHLCLYLYLSIHRARLLYTPLCNLLNEFDSDHTLSYSQCDKSFDIFDQIDCLDNPFLIAESHNFDDMRRSFSQLRQRLDHHLKKSRSRINFIRHASTGSALCLITAVVGAAVSAVVIASHAFVALVASPACAAIFPSNMTRKEMARLAQLDATAKCAYVLQNDLDTIDRLVARLHTAFENDKRLIRLGLERDRDDRYSVQEVLKQLQRNRPSFAQLLVDLEEHLFLCFAAINRARSLLFDEIRLDQAHDR